MRGALLNLAVLFAVAVAIGVCMYLGTILWVVGALALFAILGIGALGVCVIAAQDTEYEDRGL